MEDNSTNNIVTDTNETQWKSTLGQPIDSPWDSTMQKENAWETLHSRLQAEGTPNSRGANAGFVGRTLYYAAAMLAAIVLVTEIGIALKNKRSVNLSFTPVVKQPAGSITHQGTIAPAIASAPVTPLGSKMETAGPKMNRPDLARMVAASKKPQASNGLMSQGLVPNELAAQGQTPNGLVPNELASQGLAVGAPQPVVSMDQPVAAPAPTSLKGSQVQTALKVISINELEGTQVDAAQDKKAKTLHALQVQWIHQSPHAEISYQDDKTPNAGIHVKVH